MSKFSFDTKKLSSLIPFTLRKKRLTALLEIILKPVQNIFDSFEIFRGIKKQQLDNTGQVFSIIKLIKNNYKDDKCYITDGECLEETFVAYDGNENLANYQIDIPYDGKTDTPIRFLYAGTSKIAQNDFIIHLHSSSHGNIDESELCTLIDECKIAGKKYNIVYDGVVTDALDHLWIDPICVQQVILEDAYNFQWGEPVCIQWDVTWRFGWQEPICIQKNDMLF